MQEDTQTRHETTDLIDVSDVAAELDEVTPAHTERPTPKRQLDRAATVTPVTGFIPASMRDRFAAFVIDCMVLYALYWPCMLLYRAIAFDRAAGPVPIGGIHGALFHGLFLLISFLYFFLFEAVAYATPGKLLCHMRVRQSEGASPSITSVLVRNILRPFDIILMPFVIPAAVMELSSAHARLGDLIARTTIIRIHGQGGRTYSLTLDMLPSASGRLMAFLIDCGLFVAVVVGYALLLTPRQPLFSFLVVVYFPLVCVCWFTVQEALLKTSLGKWVLGYTICHEDGSLVGVAGALLRTLFRPLDMNPVGFMCAMFAIRRQRPGDVAGGTVVCKVGRRLKDLIGIGIIIVIALVLIYAGISNRSNFLSTSFEINFLPSFELYSGRGAITEAGRGILSIGDFQFAGGENKEIRRPAIFKPGETVYLIFSVAGASIKDGRAWIQEDLTVNYPDGNTGLKLENIIDFHEQLEESGPIEMSNSIALPPDAMLGRYMVRIALRDSNTGRQLSEQRFFYVMRSTEAPMPDDETPEEQPPAEGELGQ